MKGRPLSAMQHARSMLPTYLMWTSFRASLTTSLVPEYSAGSGTPTFTRATTATVFAYGPSDNAGASLSLITCASGEARFAGARRISQGVWSPTFADGTPIPSSTLLGYLTEGARTNICLQSNSFTTTWVALGTPAATQDTVGPDGTTSAWTLTDNDAGAAEGIKQDITLTAAPYAFSVFIKKTSGATTFPVLEAITGTVTANCTVDTNNGTATVWTAYTGRTMLASASATCVSVNANYWRVSLIYTATVATYTHSIFAAATSNATQSTGTIDATQQGACVIYGAQVERGSFASTYIATTTASVIRNADVLSYPSASNYSDTAGSCYTERSVYSIIQGSDARVIGDGNTASYGALLVAVTNAATSSYDGANNAQVNHASTFNTVIPAATSWSGSVKSSMARGASAVVSGAYDGSFGLTSIGIGVGGTISFFGTIRNVRIYTRALSAGELSAMTA